MASIDDLYGGALREHYEKPHNYGPLPEANAEGSAANPVCGDEVNVYLDLNGTGVRAASFDGHLCAVSKASASLMTDAVRGQNLETIESLHESFEAMMRGRSAPPLGDLEALRPVSRYRVRVRCALLPWEALRSACERRHGKGSPSES